MSYEFNPLCKRVKCEGLTFEVVLNHARFQYVKSTLEKTRLVNNDRQALLGTKRAILPHMPPPGNEVCQLCDVEKSPLCITQLCFRGKDYILVANPRPWGYSNFMLVTANPQPQSMTAVELRAGFELINHLGPDFEAIFTGVKAGASVYHFHLQIHKGSAAIWENLEAQQIRKTTFFAKRGITASFVEGWPARSFLFEGSHPEQLAAVVSSFIATLTEGDNDFSYNIGFHRKDVFRLIVFPRSGEEQPVCMAGHPDSWGRFGFSELGGSVFLLTQEAYSTIGESGGMLYDAISEMSINSSEHAKLLSACQAL